MFDFERISYSFDPLQSGLTLWFGSKGQMNLLGHMEDGKPAITTLADHSFLIMPYNAVEFAHGFYVPGCKLCIDQESLVAFPSEIPTGHLVVAKGQASIMCVGRMNSWMYLAIHGEAIRDFAKGLVFARWGIEIENEQGERTRLYEQPSS